MAITPDQSPEGRWHRARVLLRLAGLAVVLLAVATTPPGFGLTGPARPVTLCAALSAAAWVTALRPPPATPPVPRQTAVRVPALAVLVVAGGVLAGLTPGSPAVILPAVGVFDAVAALAPASALALTVAGILALTIAALAIGAGPAAISGYGFSLAAALLLGYNRRQYTDRVTQTTRLLDQEQRTRDATARAAALDERARLAREIHDVLAHSLGALAVQLDLADALLDNDATPEELHTHLQRARGLAVDGLAEARRAVAALRGDTQPLPDLLQDLLRHYATDTGAAATMQISGAQRPLDADVTLVLHRTAQEGLSNTRKHAAGAAVAMHLDYQPDAVVLTVTDLPSTLTVAASPLAATGGGFGLTGLAERAALLGATIDTGPHDTGWQVRLQVPT